MDNETLDVCMDVKEFLEDLFNLPVDLVLPGSIKPRLRARNHKDMVYVQGL